MLEVWPFAPSCSDIRLMQFWKVSGFVAGFVVTVLCLSHRTVLHTLHARMLSA